MSTERTPVYSKGPYLNVLTLSTLIFRPIPVLVTLIFMMAVSLVLVNILIAQLSNTYDRIQEEIQVLCNIGILEAITTVEWQSRFKVWVRKIPLYMGG